MNVPGVREVALAIVIMLQWKVVTRGIKEVKCIISMDMASILERQQFV